MTEVPLADADRRVTCLLHDLGQRHFVGMQTDLTSGEENAGYRYACVVATSHQASTRHRADWCRVEAGELHSFGSELVELWRLHLFRAEWSDVSVSQVVGEDEHDVRPRGCLG